MDVVSLFQFGVKEAVATLGTATYAGTRRAAVPQWRWIAAIRYLAGDAAGNRLARDRAVPRHEGDKTARRSAPVPARRRGSRHHRAAGRRGRIRRAPAAGDAAVPVLLRRTGEGHQAVHARRQGAPGRARAPAARADSRRRIRRPDAPAPDPGSAASVPATRTRRPPRRRYLHDARRLAVRPQQTEPGPQHHRAPASRRWRWRSSRRTASPRCGWPAWNCCWN